MGIKYKLLKDILNFKAGTVLWTDEVNGHLGRIEWDGWEIPLFIIEAHQDYYEKLSGYLTNPVYLWYTINI